MALFILAENPEKGILECITESRMMMKGNKWKYVGLVLSITIWLILFVAVMYGCIVGTTYLIGAKLGSVAANILILLVILFLFVTAYTILTYVITSYLYVAEGVMYLDISKKDEVYSDASVVEEGITVSTEDVYEDSFDNKE